jgi:hypothetical protein
MHRQQLEHIIRAAAGITGASEFVIVGSQAVLGQFPQAPDELLVSIEADVFSLRDPADNDLIDGSIGEGSPFHQTFGYYAHGVSVETAVLPTGWRDRLVPVRNENTGVPDRFSRHYCDFYELIHRGVAKSAAQRLDLLERVALHKSLFFKSSWAKYGEAAKGSLKISPPDQRVNALREDYARMQEMFFGEPPEFNIMMAALKEWEAQFNRM